MGTPMILPDLVLQSRINQRWQYSGMDSPDHCLDPLHFRQYPYKVEYVYNSRGFRDQEWPDSLEDLKEAIWCIGDSFTVGLGQPLDHTWPWCLQEFTGKRTVNLGLDGASNTWLARRANDVIEQIGPKNIVIMWSYVERRELSINAAKQLAWELWYAECRDPAWPECPAWNKLDLLPDQIVAELRDRHGVTMDPTGKTFVLHYPDECRRAQDANCAVDIHFENWCRCLEQVGSVSNIVHAMIPQFTPIGQSNRFLQQVHSLGYKSIGECKQVDRARDGHHFDLVTAQQVAKEIVSFLVE